MPCYLRRFIEGAGKGVGGVFQGQTGPHKCKKWQKPLELRKTSKSHEFEAAKISTCFLWIFSNALLPQEIHIRAGKGLGGSTRGK